MLSWFVPERQGQNIADFPHLKRGLDATAVRPAMVRGYALAAEINPAGSGIRAAEERAIPFGQTAASVQAAVRSAARRRQRSTAASLKTVRCGGLVIRLYEARHSALDGVGASDDTVSAIPISTTRVSAEARAAVTAVFPAHHRPYRGIARPADGRDVGQGR
jgi:hypothetical protein